MDVARRVAPSFFPLDEELKLLPGQLTPHLQEQLVRLGAWIPSFERTAELFADFTRGVQVATGTARRQTEAAGSAYVELQDQEVTRLEREMPLPPTGPAQQLLSVDGAMVPLVGGEWAEVKTLVIGEVQPPVWRQGEVTIRTEHVSYFSRLTDATTFQRLALVETQRRGIETAGAVAAVTDGAEWCQNFVDFHRPDAVRILDFPHAGEHLAHIGQAVLGEGTPAAQTWLGTHLHRLKHEGPARVLVEARGLVQTQPDPGEAQEHLGYLEKREALMQYPAFQAAGWPIGSGAVESGNKLVVEARLKGSGMHWARANVNPMLALRNVVCNDRWDEAWPQIATELRRQTAQHRAERRQQRRTLCQAPTAEAEAQTVEPATASAPRPSLPAEPTATAPAAPVEPKKPWRPAPNHPWRRPLFPKRH